MKTLLSFFLFCASSATAAVISLNTAIESDLFRLAVSPQQGGALSEFSLKSMPENCAGETGLLQEGFGVGSPYIPNRRLNEKVEVDNKGSARTVLCSYDCDGPNIAGIHVTKTIEAVPNEASVRVHWKVENKGSQRQWVAPWVRNDLAPDGKVSPMVRIDAPTLSGVMQIPRTGYYPASRNWVAVTDPDESITIFGAFNCDQTHSFLGVNLKDEKKCGFQTAFVPHLMNPGDAWETTYRVNIVRGLKHVDFASQEIAAQIDYQKGKLDVLIATVKPLQDAQIHASVVAENGRTWKLQPKKFNIAALQVVHCSFDWTAPVNGAYDFLAQLKHADGTPIDLNQELAPPHGGIDTQFVVGKTKTSKMAAWTDAPYALERGERKLSRALATNGPGAVWIESSLEKIFRNDTVEPTGAKNTTAAIHLAANEHESFQIVLRPPKDEDWVDVSLKAGPLKNPETGKTIPATNIAIYNVNYCPVRIPSYFEGPTGDYPDALTPFKRFTARAGQCSPVWFTVYAPPATPPGTYVGGIKLTAAGMRTITLRIEATVYDFELPERPALKTDFCYQIVGRTVSPPSGDSPRHDLNAYAANALDHRVTLREAFELTSPSDSIAPAATTFAVLSAMLDAPDQLKAIDAYVAQNNLKGRAFCPIADEPRPSALAKLADRILQWQSLAPNIPPMVTTFGLQPVLLKDPAIWDIHTQVMDTPSNATILEHIKNGGEVWWYVNQRPPHPYANFLLDFEAIEHRILFWQTWALGITGLHYWAVNYTEPGQDPYTDQLSVTPVNGDGFLLYPGPNGPVNSIRWENIRDGIEDYDYLAFLLQRVRALQKTGKNQPLIDKAAKILDIKDVAASLTSFTHNPAVLEKKRDEIARMIEELK